LAIAEEMIEYLKENATLEKIQYVGSLRRMKETIGDIDILVVYKKPKEVMEAFTDFPDVKDVVSKGSTRSTIVLEEQDVHVDLRGVKMSSYAAALQYFTGSKEHTVELRKQAIKQGYKLSEYGLFKKSSDKRISLSSEKALYEKLGYSYIPPELRENNGELEKAKKGKLPRLVALDDVKGDLQMHTTYSDGADEIEDMAKAAQQLGYEYIAITDHSKSERVASGLDEKQLKKQWEELDKVADKLKIKVLRGSEVDIRKDGSLDYSDEILKELHIVVAAVHSGFKMSEKEMTERIIKALNNEYVDILSHPTGRMIGKREGYQADFDTIFEVAAENGKVVEINADPERLDLNDVMIRAAKDKGVKFSIGTDSHATSSLENMKFGVGQARRGWLTKNDVVNTFSYKRLKKVFTRLP
jgi:DNA polymerase (family 10)